MSPSFENLPEEEHYEEEEEDEEDEDDIDFSGSCSSFSVREYHCVQILTFALQHRSPRAVRGSTRGRA